MEDKIKKLIEEYVEADRKYQLALDELDEGPIGKSTEKSERI